MIESGRPDWFFGVPQIVSPRPLHNYLLFIIGIRGVVQIGTQHAEQGATLMEVINHGFYAG